MKGTHKSGCQATEESSTVGSELATTVELLKEDPPRKEHCFNLNPNGDKIDLTKLDAVGACSLNTIECSSCAVSTIC